MKVLKILLGLVVVIILIGAITPLFISNDYRVERTIEINASPADIYAMVANYDERTTWDPWYEKEPTATITITGTPGESGASYAWSGEEIGAGKMTTLEMDPGKSIHSSLEFTAPFEANNDVYWTFEPGEGGTKVTWAFTGSASYPMNVFNLMMDSGVGPDFQKGLENLKKKIEG